VFTTDERADDQRRVQYYIFIQVIDVETGEILFQNKVGRHQGDRFAEAMTSQTTEVHAPR
jgi:hypothetical protein